jgi:type I restriction enzyme S subunit
MVRWKTYKLGDLVNLLSGGTPNKGRADYWNGDIPWISAKSMYEDFLSSSDLFITESGLKAGSKLAQKGTILLLTRGSGLFNRIPVCWTERSLAFNQDVKNIVSRDESVILNKYLYYWLYGNKTAVSAILETTGIGAGKIDTERFLNMQINIPSISEQKQLIRAIEPIVSKIELNNRINHNLEEQAQALYKSWFVDFDPFKDGKFIDSELGMIPESWRVYNLTEFVSITGGYSYKGSELVPSTSAMATIKNFDRDGSFKISGYKEIKPGPKIKRDHNISIFDVLVAHTDITQKAEIIGNPALVLSKSGYKTLIMSMDLCKVTSQEESISQGLLYYLLKSDLFKNHALGYVNGTTVLHLSKKALLDYKIALPSDLGTLHTISTALMNFSKLKAASCEESRVLSIIRDYLLPRLMSGNVIFNC